MALSFTGGVQAAVNPQNRGDNDTDLKRYAKTIEVVAGTVSGNSFEISQEMDGVLAMTNNVEDGKMMSWQELATRVGYSFYDFDGDGVNELVIGTNIEPYSNFPGRTMIHAVYTANGGKPECLLHGSSQKTWVLPRQRMVLYDGRRKCSPCDERSVFIYKQAAEL